jgi:hypothetical protein
LTAAGPQAVSFYKANASVTVVTSTNNYVVTINNWAAIQTLYNQYLANPTAFNNSVAINTASSNYEVAILSAFGGAINLYTTGGLTSYYPLTLNVNSGTNTASAIEVPCP